MEKEQNEKGRLVAIISHFFWLGWIIALIMHSNDRTSLGAFYLRQSLGFCLGFSIILPLFGSGILGVLLSIGLTVFWVMSFINAIEQKEQPVSVIGEFFQKIFNGIN